MDRSTPTQPPAPRVIALNTITREEVYLGRMNSHDVNDVIDCLYAEGTYGTTVRFKFYYD